MTKEQIKEKAAKFADADASKVQVQENGKGTEWESYTATVEHAKDKRVTMDFTRNGGLLISYNDTRPVGTKRFHARKPWRRQSASSPIKDTKI